MDFEQLDITAGGLTQSVHVAGAADGTPVLLIHGNCSSAPFWAPLLRHLPPSLRVVAPDLRGYGKTAPQPVDATRGLRDFADDVIALLDEPKVFGASGVRPVVVGHSMGAGVAMHLTVARPERVTALLLEAPLSPYGFGGTRDLDGVPTDPQFAGTGAGTANADFVRRLAEGDRSGEQLTAPRAVLRSAYVADPAALGADEELLLDTVLSTVVGEDNYPGTSEAVAGWPGVGPGRRGVLNAMSPRYFRVADDLIGLRTKPPIAWVRGDADAIVSDTSLFDLAYLGSLGLVPDWPGADACPPQPMVAQTRAVLDRYAATGGRYREVVYAGCGHSPHIERPAEFAAVLLSLVG
ncbi:MAG TPA: alpha/beta fold hydrolase [Micromonosporaceae bacterium]|nr:alpha/beta fold hydrolase [Micromonosporaceae bacterium]